MSVGLNRLPSDVWFTCTLIYPAGHDSGCDRRLFRCNQIGSDGFTTLLSIGLFSNPREGVTARLRAGLKNATAVIDYTGPIEQVLSVIRLMNEYSMRNY